MQTRADPHSPFGMHPDLIAQVQSHTIEISQAVAGFFIRVEASVCDQDDGNLCPVPLVSRRVQTRQEAHALVTQAVNSMLGSGH